MLNFDNDLYGEATTTVNSHNTAVAAQSGSLDVLATPFMVALMEKATCVAVESVLEQGETTVGTCINVKHSKASGIGTEIVATAVLTPDNVEGRKLVFDVQAKEVDGSVIGSGTIERFVVLSDKFMSKVESKNV